MTTRSEELPSWRKTGHTLLCQLKQLAFTLHCALQQKDPYFFLATEMIDAEKLDDVVLLYENSSGKRVGRFLQIKYTCKESGTIFSQQLLEPDSNFSLLTYFISWRKMKKNRLFRKVEVRDMILCTNMGLDLGELKSNQIYCEKAEEPDKSFELKSDVKESAWYKVAANSELNAKLYHELKATSAVRRLATLMAKCIYETIPMSLEMGDFRDYHLALVRDVFDTRTKKFHNKFVKNQGLSKEVKKFRAYFLSEFINVAQPAEVKIFEESTWAEIDKRFQKLDFEKDFGNVTELETNSGLQDELPNDCIDDEEISQFLEEFTLAVNQPNENELNEVIREKIHANNRFNLINTQLSDGTLQTKIFDWFVRQHENGKKIKYFSYKVSEELFKDMNDMVGSPITLGIKSMYCERMKAHNICFKQEMQLVRNFLNANGSNSVRNRVLELRAPKKTLLTACRVYDTLQKVPKYKKMDSFIFIDMESLKLPGIQNIVMTTFASLHYPDLLIVDCGSNRAETYSQELWNPLLRIMGQDDNKKLIIITQAGEDSDCDEESEECSFRQLTDDSRTKLLARPVFEFQGKKIDMNFGELLGIDDPENLSADESENLLGIIDSDGLAELVCNDQIKIGSVLEDLGEVRDYYIHRKMYQRIIIKEDIFADQQVPDLLVISGTYGEHPKTSEVQMNSQVNRDVTNIIVLDNRNEEEQFKALCAKNTHRNIHWLQRESGKYTWKQSQGNIANLVLHRDVTANDDNNDLAGLTYLSESQLSAYDKPLIISDTAGMGKSTLLTYLAWKMKEDNPDMLVLRIDLLQHVAALSEVKDEGTYNLGNIAEAVQFLVNELVSYKTNFERKVYLTIIAKRRKVALIFDGFDEVSPTYEGVVIDLIRGLSSYGIKKLLIATRPHNKETLEIELNAFSYKIAPFSVENQVAFLTEFWKNELDLGDTKHRTENRIKRYARVIIQKLENSIKDQSNIFTGLPLQARLAAEIFGDHRDGQQEDFDSCEEFVDSEVGEPKFPENWHLINLYERFVELRFDKYFEKTGGEIANTTLEEFTNTRFNEFIDTHKKFALSALFTEDQAQELLGSQGEPALTDDDIVEEPTGIVTQSIDGHPHFENRIYAEYFAAKFILEMLKKYDLDRSIIKIIVADILVERNYENVRAFLNCMLSESEEHHHTLENRRQWKFYLKKYRNKDEETVFHLTAAEGNVYIIRLFLDCFEENPQDRKAIKVKDDSGWTAIHRAVQHGHFDAMKLLLEQTYFNIDSQNRMGKTLLHLAVLTGKLDLATYLLAQGPDVNLRDSAGSTPLHSAAVRGQLDMAKYLLAQGANVNLRNNAGSTPLHSAVQEGKLEVTKYLLAQGADVNLQNNAGSTPLHSSAARGQLEVVKYLLDKKADIIFRNYEGWTPLHSAAATGQLEVVKYLLEKGADFYLRDNAGSTPLHSAAAKGHLEVVKFLLDKVADVNFQDQYRSTPLHLAGARGQLDVVEFLLDKGADLDLVNDYGWTPLHLAAGGGQLEVVKFFLDQGADVNVRGNDGSTPLHLAVWEGQPEVVKFLLDMGADTILRNHEGRTPLELAVAKGQLEVVKAFLDKGADVNLRNSGGWTPLQRAAAKGQLEVVKCLIDKGADLNRRNHDGWAPLHSAAQEGQLEVVKFLLEKEAYVDCQNIHGLTPLHLAAWRGQLEVTKYLLHKKAHVNCQNKYGSTPLYLAAGKGQLEVVEFLLGKKADINLPTHEGWTPLHSAAQEGQLEVAKYLLHKGADINFQNGYASTPLHSAAAAGHLKVVKSFLAKGANITSKDNFGRTPLQVAVAHDRSDVAKYLRTVGANTGSHNR